MRNNSECDKADESLFKPSRPKLSSGLEIDSSSMAFEPEMLQKQVQSFIQTAVRTHPCKFKAQTRDVETKQPNLQKQQEWKMVTSEGLTTVITEGQTPP